MDALTVFHGTTASAADVILAQGFDRQFRRSTYATRYEELATVHAAERASKADEDAVVLTLVIPEQVAHNPFSDSHELRIRSRDAGRLVVVGIERFTVGDVSIALYKAHANDLDRGHALDDAAHARVLDIGRSLLDSSLVAG